MSRFEIRKSALRTAWRMVDTIYSKFQLTQTEKELLLNLTTVVALQDLEGSRLLWERQPVEGLQLVLAGRRAVAKAGGGSKPFIRSLYSEEEVERAMDQAEDICDKYNLDEEERAALFTALPCLGLHALKDYVNWTERPPFPELT